MQGNLQRDWQRTNSPRWCDSKYFRDAHFRTHLRPPETHISRCLPISIPEGDRTQLKHEFGWTLIGNERERERERERDEVCLCVKERRKNYLRIDS